MQAVLVFSVATLLLGITSRFWWRWGLCQPADNLIGAGILLGVSTWAITEGLGAIHHFDSVGAFVAWGGLTAALVHAGWNAHPPLIRWPREVRVATGAISAMFLPLAFVSVEAAPNNWDSMTYHLSRVMHWLDGRSLDFYPTHIPRQLYLGPLAEMGIAQAMLLTHDDRGANAIQLIAFALAIVACGRIAQLIGGDATAVAVAMVAAATLPEALLEATSTQNDIVVTLWSLGFAAFTLKISTEREPAGADVFAAGASLGLAILTKGTAFVYLAPIGVLFAVRQFYRKGRGLLVIGTVLSIAFLVNVPQGVRNASLFGNPLGSANGGGTTDNLLNSVHDPAHMVSNIVRNAVMNMPTGFAPLDRFVLALSADVHDLVGVGESDSATTWHALSFEPSYSRDQDHAGNPIHLVLAGMGLVVLIVLRDRPGAPYAMAVIASALLFSILFKWQPWHTRLQVGIFMLAVPAAAVALQRTSAAASGIVAGLLLLAAVPYVVANWNRPLLGSSFLQLPRDRQYFDAKPSLYEAYLGAVDRIPRECRDVGLITNGDGWEYPLWVLTRGRVSFRNVLVANQTRSFERRPSQPPCAVIAAEVEPPEVLKIAGTTFLERWTQNRVTVLLRAQDER